MKAAVAWARANVDRFGGDRDFVAIAGCSAGGHLAALTGLTPDDPEFHVDLPDDADTSVDAVVGIYGRYDWEDTCTEERDRFVEFLERRVKEPAIPAPGGVPQRVTDRPRARGRAALPGGTRLRRPMIPVAQARDFVKRLRAASRSTVGYLELPGARHGFDMTDGCAHAAQRRR